MTSHQILRAALDAGLLGDLAGEAAACLERESQAAAARRAGKRGRGHSAAVDRAYAAMATREYSISELAEVAGISQSSARIVIARCRAGIEIPMNSAQAEVMLRAIDVGHSLRDSRTPIQWDRGYRSAFFDTDDGPRLAIGPEAFLRQRLRCAGYKIAPPKSPKPAER